MTGRSVASQIFLASAAVVAGALALVFFLTSSRAERVVRRSIALELNTTRGAIEDALTLQATSAARLARGLVAVPAYFARFQSTMERTDLASLLDQAEEYRDQLDASWVMLVDREGSLLAWTLHPERSGVAFGGGAIVRRALVGDTASGVWLEPGDDPGADAVFQAIAVPFAAPGGAIASGALIAAFAVDARRAAVLRRHTGSEVVLAVVDTQRAAHVIASTLSAAAHPALEAAIDRRAGDGRVDVAARGAGLDAHFIGAASPLVTAGGDTVALLVGLRSADQAMAAVDPLGTSTLLAFGIGLVLALLAGLWLSRRIAAPLGALVRATKSAREGNYSDTLPRSAPREIGLLANEFHALLGDLRAKEELVTLLQHDRGARERVMSARLERDAVFAGRYEISGLIGSGGMGEVYRAVDRELSETVALKVLPVENLGGNEDERTAALERFRAEIRVARRISHRNVVRTHDLGVFGDTYFLTMEYVEGRSLDDLLSSEGQLPFGAIQSVGQQLLRALEAAHEAGVVHRDIKPSNLLLDASGLLKVTDFGIARLTGETLGRRKLTATGIIVGTPAYMAPEQLAGDAVDARADLYAAGAVLFECLTGTGPHDGLSLQQVFARSVSDAAPPDPRTVRPETPAALADAVRRALAPQPGARWRSAADMLAAIDAASVR